VDARGIRNDNGIITRLADGDGELSFQSGWYYRGEGDVLDLRLAITRESGADTRRWHDHHRMTAVTLPALEKMLQETGFDVTLLEHDYTVMSPWDGHSYNAILVAVKPLP